MNQERCLCGKCDPKNAIAHIGINAYENADPTDTRRLRVVVNCRCGRVITLDSNDHTRPVNILCVCGFGLTDNLLRAPIEEAVRIVQQRESQRAAMS